MQGRSRLWRDALDGYAFFRKRLRSVEVNLSVSDNPHLFESYEVVAAEAPSESQVRVPWSNELNACYSAVSFPSSVNFTPGPSISSVQCVKSSAEVHAFP